MRVSLTSLVAAITLIAASAEVPPDGRGTDPAERYPAAKTGGFYMHNFYLPPALSSTPWWPAWSPDGRWIAVSMDGSLWTVDPSTGVATELTYGTTYHSSPAWSPDGEWIIYTADDNGRTIQLEILHVESGETHALTNDEHLYVDPVFSPDGTRVAYVSTAPNGYFNVYIRSINDGMWAGPAVAVTSDNLFGADRLYFGDGDLHISPAWLPDGDELLLVSNRDVPLGSGHVYRVPATADAMADDVIVRAEQTLYRTRPDVSSDGTRFVYSSTSGAADQFNNLYVQPTTGGEPYKLTFFEHDAFHPRWSPDGDWIAFISNARGLPQLALLETHGGALRTIPITERRRERPMGTLSVRVIDGASEEVTDARVHLTASDGKAYAPADTYARVSGAGGDRMFHTTGTFSTDVPPGTVVLDVMKGFEYVPERVEVDVVAGETAEATVRLTRMADMTALGWYSASTHVHMNYAGNLHNTLENLMAMSAAEDQDLVLEQVANKDNRVLDYQHFVAGGGQHPLSTMDRILVVGQEYRPPFYGHVFMFGLRDHLISPFTTGYEGTALESLYPSNTDMLRKAKAQGATVGYVHAFAGEDDPLEQELGSGKGFMVDAALGTTDALEWSVANRASFAPWYAVLNNDFRVTAVGGEDSISNLHNSKLVGSVRTYVHTGERGLDMDAWFDGVRAGRAFVTTGPLVQMTVNGRLPGEEVRLRHGETTVELTGEIQSITPLEQVLIVFNGEVVERIPLDGDRRSLELTRTLPVTRSGWFHLRAEGRPEERYPLDAAYALGFTNPVWVVVGDQPVRSKAAADYAVRWIDTLQAMAEAWPGWRSDKERAHVFAQFEEARAIYRQRGDEAVDEGSPPTQHAGASRDREGKAPVGSVLEPDHEGHREHAVGLPEAFDRGIEVVQGMRQPQ